MSLPSGPRSSGKRGGKEGGREGGRVSEACTDCLTKNVDGCGNEMSIWAREREREREGGAIVLPDIQRRLSD